MTTLEITELYKQGLEDIRIISASRAPDEARMRFRLEKLDSAAPFAFGEEITLTEEGRVLFHGYVTRQPAVDVSTRGVTCEVVAENIIALLDATPYVEDQSLYGIWLKRTRLTDARSLINHILRQGLVAPGGGEANESFINSLTAFIQCPVGSGSQTCWSLIEACLHWVPNAATWYRPDTRTLLIRSQVSTLLNIDVNQKKAKKGDNEVFCFAGCSHAVFSKRLDLLPPSVGLSWEEPNKSIWRDVVFPEGGNLRQPWAFRFQVPKLGGGSVTDDPEQRKNVQQAAQPSMLVKGRQVPTGWDVSGNMKSSEGISASEWYKFWSGFSAMSTLKKTNLSCLAFGKAIFAAVPVDDAFPAGELAEEEDTEVPANYEAFQPNNLEKLYVLYQGQFPASSKASDNVSGLKFCKGKLKQYVWLKEKYTGEATKTEAKEFFSGKFPLKGEDINTANYALLELDAVFINRRRKKYQVGTNELASDDDDYVADDNSTTEDAEATAADYIKAAQDYYSATRRLYYDGSITLHGVKNYEPSALVGAVSVIGLRADWETMNTPIVQAEYDPKRKTLTLSTGSPEILTIDERVHRTLLGRQSNLNAGTTFADPPRTTSGDGGGDSGSDDDSSFPMVGPSISANVAAVKSGKPLNPFQVYEDEDGKVYINEGTLVAPGGKVINFSTTEVTDRAGDGVRFSVRAERVAGTSEWEAVIRVIK